MNITMCFKLKQNTFFDSLKSVTFLLLFLTGINFSFSLESLENCVNTTKLNVSISKIGLKESSGNNNSKVTFSRNERIQFEIECTHNEPVKWIFDEDFVRFGIKESSYTFRDVGDFFDESTYKYTAVYNLDISEREIPLVIACHHINPNGNNSYPKCGNQAVFLASLNGKLGTYSVELLGGDNIVKNLIVKDFYNRLTLSESKLPECPFHLTLLYFQESARLSYDWNPHGGMTDILKFSSVQSLENAYRFESSLNEKCVQYEPNALNESECHTCIHYDVEAHQFKPLSLGYSLGSDRATLKGFFDLKGYNNFQYRWTYTNPKDQVVIYVGNVGEEIFYKGQQISVECQSNLFLFSYGTLIGWSAEGETNPQFILTDNEISQTFGQVTIKATAIIAPEKSYLDKNLIDSINISCISPIWNSTKWITVSQTVDLLDSEFPMILTNASLKSTLPVDNQFSLKCEAFGIPSPDLNIKLPQENLNFTINITKSENRTVLVLYFPKFESNYAGDYNCVATSSIGQDYKLISVNVVNTVSTGIPYFFKLVLLAGGIATLLFILTTLALQWKLKKEKKDFLLLTEEAVQRFHDGFRNSSVITFDSNADHKNFEIPMSKWGIGTTLLGSGAGGQVKKGFVIVDSDKTTVAVKTVNSPKDVTEFEKSLLELTIMSYIGKHAHIVSLVAACTDNLHRRSLMLGLEFCSNGDLLNYLRKKRPLFHSYTRDGQLLNDWISGNDGFYVNVMNSANFSTLDLYRWSYQIADAMAYLEEKKILHLDLACRNVLLNHEKIAKVGDFGLSRQLVESNNYTKKTNSALPWRWLALESLKFQKFSSKSDVWSYGVTLYEIFSLGLEPWPSMRWTNEFVNELEWGLRLSRPLYATENIYNRIMLECWRNEPEERINFSECRDFFRIAVARLSSNDVNNDNYLTLC